MLPDDRVEIRFLDGGRRRARGAAAAGAAARARAAARVLRGGAGERIPIAPAADGLRDEGGRPDVVAAVGAVAADRREHCDRRGQLLNGSDHESASPFERAVRERTRRPPPSVSKCRATETAGETGTWLEGSFRSAPNRDRGVRV